MASPTTTRAAAPKASVSAASPLQPNFPLRKVVLATVGLVIFAGLVVILYTRVWPFSQESVLQDLKEASDSTVTARSSRQTYFPSPGCILENVEFRHGKQQFTLITIDKLIIQGSYNGILRRHVPRITAIGARVFIPPFGSEMTFQTEHSNTVVDEIVANGTMVEFAEEGGKKPLRFDVHEATLNGVRWGSPIGYKLKFHNPEPPGELDVEGDFGSWTTGQPGETPISGKYTFERADLGVYRGIGGFLDSQGTFRGTLKHINIQGSTDTPDFNVTSGGHKVRLRTRFDAYVDAIHGDTFLNRVVAYWGRTTVAAEGSVAGSPGQKGKSAQLRLTSRQGRIEDILGLFVSKRSPMSGTVSLQAQAGIPSGPEPFLDKVKLNGAFGIDSGTFTKPETQKDVDALSAGARGDNKQKEDPETVMTDLKGQVTLAGGIAQFSDLSFGIPGARARMHGTYNIINHKIDLHGRMRVDTKISKTEQGVKALLLKIMDPIFKKKKKGEVVPVHISGTYEKPQFGLDLGQQPNPIQATK